MVAFLTWQLRSLLTRDNAGELVAQPSVFVHHRHEDIGRREGGAVQTVRVAGSICHQQVVQHLRAE